MSMIRLKTNQHQLIANLRHAFTPASMLGELLQNARRAKAQHIEVIVDNNTLIVRDDGTGIADLQTLIFIAESGWDQELKERENAFGLGILSTLYFAEYLSVHSRDQAFRAATAAIIHGDAIEVHPAVPRLGSEIQLEGVKSPQATLTLSQWAAAQLERLCEAFPVPISFNGVDFPRPLADPTLPWREAAVGKVLLNLDTPPSRWRCFLQGLPLGGRYSTDPRQQVVLLRDDMIARLPDRQHLLNEETDNRRIQDAINAAYRQALFEAKEQLSGSDFVSSYAETCLSSSNADLLNDVPFAPRAWFRNWEGEPPGYRRFWDHHPLSGIVARLDLEEKGVWSIESDGREELAAESYLAARQAFLLEEPRIDEQHWLRQVRLTTTSDQVCIHHGAILYREDALPLAEALELVLVEALNVSLKGEPGQYPVKALRQDDTLYLTPSVDCVTPLVSDYIFDDRYDEDAEVEDDETLSTFIAVGCSQVPSEVVKALLPRALRFASQPKLANAEVQLVFDSEGKLLEVKS